MPLRRPLVLVLVAACATLGAVRGASGASVIAVATLGQPAPGGGIFAGSGFAGVPAAAGTGWVAFRSSVAPEGTSEELVLANMTAASSRRISVARTGLTLDDTLGKILRFIGEPAVNASGDVAFVVSLTPPTAPPAGSPAPAAVLRFVAATGTLEVIATAGMMTPLGALALVEGPGGTTASPADRTPAIAADDSVAFSALGIDGTDETAGIFLVRDGATTVVAAADSIVLGSRITSLGPPALNAQGHVAFRATFTDGPLHDGILLWRDGTPTLVAADGTTVTTTEPTPTLQTLEEFHPVLDLTDDDTIAFAAGPLVDYTSGPDSTDSDFGVLRWRDAMLDLIAFPGQTIPDRGRVTGLAISGEFGGALAPPHVAPDGSVVFHAELNFGSSAALARLDVAGAAPTPLIVTGGGAPTATPVGGTYSAFVVPPTIDGTGTPVVVAELRGAPTPAAVVYAAESNAQVIPVGEPSPGTTGFLGGPPFDSPAINDDGDVVFRGSVASGPSAGGLYRWRAGTLTPLVRAGDPAPVDGAPPFLAVVGQHDQNADGTVAFAAFVDGLDRGIYTVDAGGTVEPVAVVGGSVRLSSDTVATFDTVLPNPAIAPDGAVAFRARIEFTPPGQTSLRRSNGIFLKSGTQTRAIVLEDDEASATETFQLFREVAVSSGGQIAFVADVGDANSSRRGLFFTDSSGVRPVLLEGDRLQDPVTDFVGGPQVSVRGVVAQLVRVASGGDQQAMLVRGTPARLNVVAKVGDHSPTGGVYRSLGVPAMNRSGQVAFRATFEGGTGGTSGIITATDTATTSTILIGDPGPAAVGGTFVGINQRMSLNDGGAVAFVGSLAGGDTRDGVFVGEPINLRVSKLRMRVGTATKPDRITLGLRLAPGNATRTLDLGAERVRVAVRDAAGARWNEIVSAGDLRRRRRAFVFSRPPTLPKLKLRKDNRGGIRVNLRATPDLTGGGLFAMEPPLTVDFDIGDVSAQASVNCLVSPKRVRCR
jgi:hypothetical protein